MELIPHTADKRHFGEDLNKQVPVRLSFHVRNLIHKIPSKKGNFHWNKASDVFSKMFKDYNATLCSISRKNKYPVLYPTLSPKIQNKMWPFCCSFIHWNPRSSPFHSPIQEVEEGLKHHMVACLVGVMQFGCVQGDGGPWRVSYTLKIHKHTILAGYHSAEQKQFVTIFQATAAPPPPHPVLNWGLFISTGFILYYLLWSYEQGGRK